MPYRDRISPPAPQAGRQGWPAGERDLLRTLYRQMLSASASETPGRRWVALDNLVQAFNQQTGRQRTKKSIRLQIDLLRRQEPDLVLFPERLRPRPAGRTTDSEVQALRDQIAMLEARGRWDILIMPDVTTDWLRVIAPYETRINTAMHAMDGRWADNERLWLLPRRHFAAFRAQCQEIFQINANTLRPYAELPVFTGRELQSRGWTPAMIKKNLVQETALWHERLSTDERYYVSAIRYLTSRAVVYNQSPYDVIVYSQSAVLAAEDNVDVARKLVERKLKGLPAKKW